MLAFRLQSDDVIICYMHNLRGLARISYINEAVYEQKARV